MNFSFNIDQTSIQDRFKVYLKKYHKLVSRVQKCNIMLLNSPFHR